jgi:hypothetical protein
MRPVATPIIVTVMMSVLRRPIRSPSCPNTMAPSGRATKPSAFVRNAARKPPKTPSGSKNSGPRKNAER